MVQEDINSARYSSKQIKRGAVMSYIAIFFNIAAGLAYTPWMVKQIGQSEYGLYSLAITLISFFTIDFGLGETVSRFLSKYSAENNENNKRDFLGIVFKIYFMLDLFILIALIVVFIYTDVIYAELTSSEIIKLRVVFSIAALYSVASFPFLPLNGVLISNERFAFFRFTDLINKMFTIATMVIVLLLGYRLYALVIVNAIMGITTIGLKLWYINKNKLIKINFKAKDRMIVKAIFGFSVWTAIITVAQRFILNITPTILAAFAGSLHISLFSIAMTLEGFTWTFANALNGLFLPKVTRMITKNDNSLDVENLMIRVGRIQFVLIGLLIVGFFTMGKEFMVLWMGENFSKSYYVTLLLIAPCIITLTQQIGNTALLAINEIKYRAYCSMTVACISTLLSILLSQKFGAIGAGIAICIGNFFGLIIGMNIVYYKVLKINVFRFFKECHIKMSLPLVLSMVIGIIIQWFIPAENLFLFMIKASVLGSIYLFLMWVLALNQGEKTLFLGIAENIAWKLRREKSV